MIASLTGAVSALGLDFLVLNVHGVGYLVKTSPQTLASVRHNDTVTVHTELVVREDSMTLYGFLTKDETDLFRTVQSVSGIGPRIAIAVLAVMEPHQFARAVMAEDIKAITSIPGIGPKGAKRLALELKDKVAPFALAHPETSAPAAGAAEPEAEDAGALSQAGQDVVQGLVGLGWAEKVAYKAVVEVLEEQAADADTASMDSGVLLRLALRHLGGRS